jgi:hypothetical protein
VTKANLDDHDSAAGGHTCRKALLFLKELCVCESLSLTDLPIEPELSGADLIASEQILEIFNAGPRFNAKAISESSINCKNQYTSTH